ncbi:MAG: hypothetical protein KKB50_19945 [Planctomycetes bacterium]|nr:hypothetical protein [Planctomycetota bacterium]
MSHEMSVKVVVVLLSVALVLPAAAQSVRTVAQHGPDGLTYAEQLSPSRSVAPVVSGGGRAIGSRDSGVIWHNYLTDAMYNNTGISIPAGQLFTGTWLNPPTEFELLPLEGDGTPDWVYPGTDCEVSASRSATVLAGLDFANETATIHKWQPGSSTPDWTYVISPCVRATHESILVSDDGSTIAALVTMQATENYARLYCFEAGAATPTAIYDPPGATFARSMALSADGRYIAIYATASVYVYDRVAGAERFSTSAGASNDAIALSGDGQYLAYGWSVLYLRHWTGSTYALDWTRSGSGYYLAECCLSADASTLASAWYNTSFNRFKVELHDVPASTPAWTFLSQVGSGGYQEVPADVVLTADGGYCAVASWGDQMQTNPEVHVFEHSSSAPVLTLDTPGSLFDVDIATAANGTVYVSACGKHIHANEHGRGGDLYSVRYEVHGLGDLNCDGRLDGFDIDAFVLALNATPPDYAEYFAVYPDCDVFLADINGDGDLNGFDIDPFVALLSGE